MKTKLSILAWFSVALLDVTADRPNVFPKQTEEEKQAAAAADQSDVRTWMSVFRDLLGPKWGTMDQLKHTNAMFVLDDLEERQIEFKKATKKS